MLALSLAGVALLAIPGSPWHRKPTLGLDLQGGIEVVLRAVPARGDRLNDDDVQGAVLVIENRIDKLGVSEHDVRKVGRDLIAVQLAGVRDPAVASRVIRLNAQLAVYDLERNLVAGPEASLYELLTRAQASVPAGAPASWYLFDRAQRLVRGPRPSRAALLRGLQRPPPGSRLLRIPRQTIVHTCAAGGLCPDAQKSSGQRAFYLFRHDPPVVPELTGPDFKPAPNEFDPEAPVVHIFFTPAGAKKFRQLSVREIRRGRVRGQNQHAVVVLDRQIQAFGGFDYREDTRDITGNSADFRGADLEHLARLAVVLQTGSLPVTLKEVERTEVSATLGRDALADAERAAVVGLLLVIVFLLLLYRFLGFVAVLGLLIYVAFLYALILRLHVTLTLPGFAGLVLTIGLAADANVVIFERIKEEVRRGKSVRAAVGAGYVKGFRTIIDAHIVTAVTAAVLFAVVTGPVRGFALMLLFGTVVSLVTAVAATRAMLGLLAGFRWFNDAKFMGAQGEQRLKRLEIDFVGRRRWAFALSGAAIAVAAASLSLQGLNLGLDFKSGSQLTFTTSQPATTEGVRGVLALIDRPDAVVQGRGAAVDGGYTSWQVRTTQLSPAQSTRLQAELERRLAARDFGVTTVSAGFARHLVLLTLWAVLGSLAAVLVYVAWRFGVKFALPVIVALLHDLAITAGVYSLSGREVSASTVAALLTVLGYSIYDTMIVFDRIRENIQVLVRAPFATIANVSLWQTIRRSLATTLITLLPIVSLLAFGSPTLKDFAFAILLGILSGTYSSIFIATPLLALWKHRRPALRPAREPIDELRRQRAGLVAETDQSHGSSVSRA